MLVQIEPDVLFCLQTNTDITLRAEMRYVGAHMHYRLKFRDLLLIAESMLGIPAEELERTVCIFRAEASLAAPFARVEGVDLHPDPVERAAICAMRVVRSGPFLRGNREIAHMCLLEILTRSGYLWPRQAEDETEIPAKFRGLQAGTISEKEFLRWVRSRVKRATGLEDEPTA
jgi:prophage maintenance system killer protein